MLRVKKSPLSSRRRRKSFNATLFAADGSERKLLEGRLVEELLLVHARQHLPVGAVLEPHFTTRDATSARWIAPRMLTSSVRPPVPVAGSD